MSHYDLGQLLEEAETFSLTELSQKGRVSVEIIIEMVEFNIIQPAGHSAETWQFSLRALARIQKALRLQRDLEINLSGVALALDLIEEIENLKTEISRLEHFVKLHQTE
ncbi:MAG: MerR family transcriptional regulator [Gammaproteobacteria bacterium]|jgi:chaperone modulatory protein CbpM|nr:MerR family transcriptional regulator [Gammaproteobacteria bacterium]